MPILGIEIVATGSSELGNGLAERLADAAGEVFGSPLGRTWVKLRAIANDQYAKNGGGPPEGVLPVFVTLLKRELPPPEEMREEARALAEAIAHVCQRSAEDVHILYQPAAAGRIVFGGRAMGLTRCQSQG